MNTIAKYMLLLDRQFCGTRVWVNGIEILSDLSGGQVTVRLPLNQWLKSGTNTFRIDILPLRDLGQLPPQAYCNATVESDDVSGTAIIARLKAVDADLASPMSARFIAGECDISMPFEWRWQSAVAASNVELRLEMVTEELEKFWHVCEQKSISKVVQYLSVKNSEVAQAYGMPSDHFERECRGLFEDLFFSENWGLAPLQDGNAVLRLFADGKLSRLDTERGKSPLYYLGVDGELAVFLPIIFCEDHDGSLRAVR